MSHKDYVLGHFLNVLFSYQWAKENLIFKGGTCLRKCYFENYRFSEDIDLTIRNQNFILTRKAINDVCEKLKNDIGIETNMLMFEEVQHNNQKVGGILRYVIGAPIIIHLKRQYLGKIVILKLSLKLDILN